MDWAQSYMHEEIWVMPAAVQRRIFCLSITYLLHGAESFLRS
jgi:hypothetical protein